MSHPSESIAASDTQAWLWTGAAFTPAEGLPVTDRGFRYGISVFESFPVREGVGIFLERHLARLREACETTGLAEGLPTQALPHIPTILEEAPDGFARIYVTAGDGPVTAPFDNCRLLILAERREPVPARVYHRGYDLALHAGAHIPLFPGVKSGNYWANLRAFREGVAAHCNETLLFTPAGHLVSACMANVFIVSGDRVQTPGLGTGARPGVMREWVMRQLPVEESLITRAQAESADEIFLTSSWLGIMPVASINHRPIEKKTISAPLLAAYRKEIGENIHE